MIFRAALPDAMLVAPLDLVTAVFHRPSGQTHLLVEPAPEILDALGGDGLTLNALREVLASRFELDDADALAERVGELVAAGLVTQA